MRYANQTGSVHVDKAQCMEWPDVFSAAQAGQTGFEFLLSIVGDMEAYQTDMHKVRFKQAMQEFGGYTVAEGVR